MEGVLQRQACLVLDYYQQNIVGGCSPNSSKDCGITCLLELYCLRKCHECFQFQSENSILIMSTICLCVFPPQSFGFLTLRCASVYVSEGGERAYF